MHVCMYVCMVLGYLPMCIRMLCMYVCHVSMQVILPCSCFVVWGSSMRGGSLLHRLASFRNRIFCYHSRWYVQQSCTSTKAPRFWTWPKPTGRKQVNLTMITPIRKMRTEIRGRGTARDPRTRCNCSPLRMSVQSMSAGGRGWHMTWESILRASPYLSALEDS